jgi:hypothetical protein
MIAWRTCLAALFSIPGVAYAWSYSPVMTVNKLDQARTFQHLESSGNRAIAISQSEIAVTWEDNRSGKPEVYVAFKPQEATHFGAALRVSDPGPAYEPAITGLLDGRFVVAWEAKDRVWARIVSPRELGPVQSLAQTQSRQATLSSAKTDRFWLAWAQQASGHYQIVAGPASVQGDRIQPISVKPVDPAPPKQDQLYPTIALTHDGVVIGWEDRRYGHTRLFTAFAPSGSQAFSPLHPLNELKPARSNIYGLGTGAMRVVLASDGGQHIIGSWLDKRDFADGYDVYAAFSHDSGRNFGRNEKVEDMLGANQAQWHAVTAMDHQGHTVVAWDDQRDGSPDVWLSWYTPSGWSDDDSPKGANGNGSQSHPSMVFDRKGRLHLVFLDRNAGRSAIRYLVVTPAASDFGSPP